MAVIVKKNTAVNRAGKAMKKAGKDATAKGLPASKRSDVIKADNKYAVGAGRNSIKAGNAMARKTRKGK